jgi:hypothetical protein
MDTEFPGVVARPYGTFRSHTDYLYQTLKCNVDLLRLIQVAMSRRGLPPLVVSLHFSSVVLFHLGVCENQSQPCPLSVYHIFSPMAFQVGLTFSDENGNLHSRCTVRRLPHLGFPFAQLLFQYRPFRLGVGSRIAQSCSRCAGYFFGVLTAATAHGSHWCKSVPAPRQFLQQGEDPPSNLNPHAESSAYFVRLSLLPQWQFHFQFELGKDIWATDSIDLLRKVIRLPCVTPNQFHSSIPSKALSLSQNKTLAQAGVDFERHEKEGIEPEDFGSCLMVSGLTLCPEVRWVSFHSYLDFGYLIKILSSQPLPDKESAFFALLGDYFPCF